MLLIFDTGEYVKWPKRANGREYNWKNAPNKLITEKDYADQVLSRVTVNCNR